MKHLKYISAILLFITLSGCKKTLELTPKDEFAPGNVLTSEAGIKALLYSSYSFFQTQVENKGIINISEVTTDMAANAVGAEFLALTPFMNFTWDATPVAFERGAWADDYRCIRDANLVLENIDKVQTSDATKKRFAAEARFLRAYSYAHMYDLFGPVPLRTSSDQEQNLARATVDEMKTFIEAELNGCVTDLPDPGKEEVFGRANKGSAMAVLAKFCLSTKQWQKAADASKKVIDFNYYQLYPIFRDMFKVANEGNKEMILVKSCKAENGYGNWFPSGAMPVSFDHTDQLPEYKWTTAMTNVPTDYLLRDAFVNTFDLADNRFILVIRKYVNIAGVTVDLSKTKDNSRSFKFFDNNAIGNNHGNDYPLIRYADILLTRSEALNELNGVNPESISLINQVRGRANIAGILITNVASKDAFRDMILRERGWEFISEGKRREDLIRHGKFISGAIARGIAAAKPTQVLFPIPQSEIDANKAIVQNPGY